MSKDDIQTNIASPAEDVGDMRLGRLEFLAMNNPVRRWMQKHIEFKVFRRQLGKRNIELEGGIIMDAGCGSGYSTELIVHEFHPSEIVAFDFMPEQIRLARKRGLKVDFSVGDLRRIEAESEKFDAVFIFGVLHHIAQWKEAVSEAVRVLKRGGVLLVDEPLYLFTWEELEDGFRNTGLEILEVSSLFFKYSHAYLCRKRE
jgi:ubiquinone/menaquinone biosynthesis C-methylase UbiE